MTRLDPADRLLPAQVRARLATESFGRRLYYYPEVPSTNDAAAALARADEPEGSVVYTDFQSAGRGRGGHRWVSPPGRDLLFSVVLRPPGDPRAALPVTLVAALAAAAVLSSQTGADVGVKWPNDLFAGGRKLGGILAESAARSARTAWVVLGVGINVNLDAGAFDASLGERATSCRILRGEPLDRAGLFADLLGAFEGRYARFRSEGFAPMAGDYAARHILAGRRVRVGEATVAKVVGVAADGALVVREQESGRERTLYGETIEVIP